MLLSVAQQQLYCCYGLSITTFHNEASDLFIISAIIVKLYPDVVYEIAE